MKPKNISDLDEKIKISELPYILESIDNKVKHYYTDLSFLATFNKTKIDPPCFKAQEIKEFSDFIGYTIEKNGKKFTLEIFFFYFQEKYGLFYNSLGELLIDSDEESEIEKAIISQYALFENMVESRYSFKEDLDDKALSIFHTQLKHFLESKI